MSVIHAPQKQQMEPRFAVFLALIGLGLVSLFLRLWYLQVVESQHLQEKAEFFRASSVAKLAPRGLIEDRNGVLLAAVKPQVVITAIPHEVNKKPWVLDKVALMLNVPVAKLKEKVEDGLWRAYLPTPIFVGAPVEIATRIAESSADLPGIGVDTQPMREYVDSKSFSHVLGYVWTPSAKDVERFKEEDRKPADYVGKLGLEYVYERDLMGSAGSESLEMDAKSRPLRVLDRVSPAPGDRLVLSLDADLQRTANEGLADVFKRMRAPGAVVALDPRNGEVLALATSPSYDTAVFKGGVSRSDWKALNDDPLHPMTNRALFGVYAPGSTFKMLTALATEQKGIFNPNAYAYCAGYYEIGNRKFKCLGRHGSISFYNALTKSCNAYFSDLGVRAGREAIVAAAQDATLGAKTGIDLLGESRGTLPTDTWIRAVQGLKPNEEFRWYLGNTVNISIGQGDVGATPLQMANAAAMIANSGMIYQPHLVRAKVSAKPGSQVVRTEAKILRQVKARPEFWPAVRAAMVNVMESGTARSGTQIPGVRWAGKTGSSEHKKGTKTHSWFVGFAPAENPVIAIAVVVESAGHGGEVAAPLAARVVRKWLEKGQKPVASNVASASSR